MLLFSEANPSSGADYIGLNQNESSLGRKRGLVSAPTLCTVTESQANLARSAAMCIKEVGLILKPEICQTILDEDRVSLVESIEKVRAYISRLFTDYVLDFNANMDMDFNSDGLD